MISILKRLLTRGRQAPLLALLVLAIPPTASAQELSSERINAKESADSLATSLFQASASVSSERSVNPETVKRREIAVQALSRAASDADRLAQDIDGGLGPEETRAQMAKLQDLDDLLRALGPDAVGELITAGEASEIIAEWERLQKYHHHAPNEGGSRAEVP